MRSPLIKAWYLKPSAQTLLEYTILIGIITMVMVTMGTHIRRGIQGIVKTAADQLALQQNSEQATNDPTKGYLDSAASTVRTLSSKRTTELGGSITYNYDDESESRSDSLVNAGFTNRSQD